jgi:hypothetical protein
MNIKTLLQRKFRSKWSDLQLLVMLALGEEMLVTYSEIICHTGGSQTGVWNALAMIKNQDCADSFVIEGRIYYHLTDKGRSELHKLLK